MPSGWGGNRRSGIALAICHPPTGSWTKEGRWAPRLHFLWVWHLFTFCVRGRLGGIVMKRIFEVLFCHEKMYRLETWWSIDVVDSEPASVHGFTSRLHHPDASWWRCRRPDVVSITSRACSSPQHAGSVERRPTVRRRSHHRIHQELAAYEWVESDICTGLLPILESRWSLKSNFPVLKSHVIWSGSLKILESLWNVQYFSLFCTTTRPWQCWLGIRKSIRPVRIERWSVGVVICLERGALQTVCLWSRWCHCIPKPHHLLPHLNPDWFYLSRYWLTQIVLESRPLNGCNSSSSSSNLLLNILYYFDSMLSLWFSDSETLQLVSSDVLQHVVS